MSNCFFKPPLCNSLVAVLRCLGFDDALQRGASCNLDVFVAESNLAGDWERFAAVHIGDAQAHHASQMLKHLATYSGCEKQLRDITICASQTKPGNYQGR